jgi:nuclear protein localization family protein 4
MGQLARLGAPGVHDSRQGGGDAGARPALARWLSDWHLVAFLGTTGLFSEVRARGARGAR